VTALTRLRQQELGTLVAKEIVAREDVVHLQALRAREALADVTLQERLVMHALVALPIRELSA